MKNTKTQVCQQANPLARGGTSQKTRLLQALRSDYVQVDERSVADLLVFAKKLAAQLHYYDLEDTIKGDWDAFFAADVSVIIALLADTDATAYETTYQQLKTQLQTEIDALYAQADPVTEELPASVLANIPQAIPAFKQLFDFIFSLSAYVDQQIRRIPATSGLADFARGIIRRDGRHIIRPLMAYYKVGINEPGPAYVLIDATQRKIWDDESGLPQKFAQDIIQDGLQLDWLGTSLAWAQYYSTEIDPNDWNQTYGPADLPLLYPAQIDQRIGPVRSLLDRGFQQLQRSLAAILEAAPPYLDETLNEWPDHEPQIALYLVFLKLYRILQDHQNSLRDRHLDYYYHEVLRLRPQAAVPDSAHLLVELAKQVDQHILPEGTIFKGGKDDLGKEVQYVLTQDSSLNKAKVEQLHAVYHTQQDGKLFITAFPDTLDGIEEALPKEEPAWPAFGPAMRFRGETATPEAPTGDEETTALFQLVQQTDAVGFGIASPNLFLREGERTITLDLHHAALAEGVSIDTSTWLSDQFRIRLTTEDGWIETQAGAVPTIQAGRLQIICSLSPEDPAVVPYTAAVHGGRFTTTDPLLVVEIDAAGATKSPYLQLRHLRITHIKTTVMVSGLKQLNIANPFGAVDPAKPFMPFGPNPKVGSRFVIGSNEVFRKKLTGNLKIDFAWEGNQADNFVDKFIPKAPIHVLVKNMAGTNSGNQLIFDQQLGASDITVGASAYGQTSLSKENYEPETSLTVKEKQGYIFLELQESFGHHIYQHDFPLALIQLAQEKDKRDDTIITALDENFYAADLERYTNAFTSEVTTNKKLKLPDPPYTPLASGISLDYTATSTFYINAAAADGFANRQEQFFHVSPLGQREEHSFLRVGAATPFLVPEYPHEGELYIGLSGLGPRQQCTLLLQVAEGSANPLRETQTVHWSYLSHNHWQPLNDSDYTDQTNGLLESGLVRITLPKDVTTDHTWLSPDRVWLRVAVTEYTDAVCQLLRVAAPALRVEFKDQQNDPDFLATPLSAGTISKLKISDAAIKKLEQPYPAFGGKPEEEKSAFYQRISERLRHKDRAITIFDYERLILAEFPDIHRVKCLNHTRVRKIPNTASYADDELAPGHVLVVAIPEQQAGSGSDPLRPYTSLATLARIKEYLQARLSMQVQLDVRNPRLEEIQLDFQVRFRPDRDPTIYEAVLNQDIIRFLSPWAYGGGDIEFGGRIHKSLILDFVEEREYVDFVLEFKLHQNPDDPIHKQMDIEAAVATSGRSVLVSHHQHTINEAVPCTTA